MTDSFVFFDIETTAQPEAELLERFKPTFDANKTLKDPEKIAADIAAKRKAWIDESALHAERGRILCIGYQLPGDGVTIIDDCAEKEILAEFLYVLNCASKKTWCGFNVTQFDLPFIRKRCIINGIPFPFYDRTNKWEPWTFKTYDPMLDWQSGDRRAGYVGLVNLAKALDIPAEDDGIGAKFGEVYATNRDAALQHCRRDVELVAKVTERMLA